MTRPTPPTRRLRLMEPLNGDYVLRRWTLQWKQLREDLGCVWHSDRIVALDQRLREEEAIGTAWHEAIHVAVPNLNEEAVLAIEWNLRELDSAVRKCLDYEAF